MIKKLKGPDCLVTEAEEYMLAVGYSLFTMVRIKRAWLFVRSFMRSSDLNCYSVDIAKLAVDQYQESFLKVKDSKNGKERIIPISSSVVAMLKQYDNYKAKLPVKKSGYLFVNLMGKKCGYGSVEYWYKECLRVAGIKCVGRSGRPRIHDLRHTFAVTSLASMAEAGIDLYASLPILSTYIGHQSLGATNHYVRLTSNMYPDLIRDVDTICLDVLPKLNFYEAD